MPDQKRDSIYVALGLYGGVGFQLAIQVVIGLLAGQWLDKKWGTEPWLLLAGLVLGCISGFYQLLKILKWKERKQNGNASSQ